ncbi:pyridoxal phosphate-dependent transferase [Lasiosphaeria hispida]|uniref:Pyridoxal phosphate-dependent transferase n=1 Tax=Lasiosphaeria hispida TaxID=260671 RepID=A0AAJ0HJ59_9PEZI|nr:pyridoxal phosphate-dependent transferase [Lasiosphaeria hispida]
MAQTGNKEPETKQPEKKLINLLRGWPSPHLLPSEILRRAADKVLSDPAVFVPALQYGPDPGYEPLREALAVWLSAAYGVKPDVRELCITGGASQNIACVLQSYTDPVYTLAVWAVTPCYFLACPIFEDAGFGERLRGLPEDEEEVDVEFLERALQECEEKEGREEKPYKHPTPHRKLYRHIIYLVPTCANPSGKTLPLARRTALVHLARRHNALIIADDVYDLLQWPTTTTTTPSSSQAEIPPLPRLSDIDIPLGPSPHDPPARHFGHAVSNGSFSKLLGPGVRTGWAHGTPDFAYGLAQTGSTRSGGAPSQLTAAIVTQVVVDGGLDGHLRERVRPALQARHTRVVEAVKRELGWAGVRVVESSEGGRGVFGGYFVWVTLPEGGPTAAEVAERARAEELIVAPGGMFEVGMGDGGRFERNLRLCFSWEEEEVVVEGVERLGTVLRRWYQGTVAVGEKWENAEGHK